MPTTLGHSIPDLEPCCTRPLNSNDLSKIYKRCIWRARLLQDWLLPQASVMRLAKLANAGRNTLLRVVLKEDTA